VKISLKNKYEALARLPEYKKDWEKFQSTDDKQWAIESKKFKEKYGIPKIPSPFNPNRKRPYPDIDILPVEVIPRKIAQEISEPQKSLHTFEKILDWVKKSRKSERLFIREDRYLHLKIDLTASIPALVKAFKDEIKKWRPAVQDFTSLAREKKTKVNPWMVYDLNKFEDKNLLQITKQKFGVKENPTYDSDADVHYQRVKRAFKKAKSMINAVKP
jgi:tetratricopeptide (TPR) repeat protein